MTAESTARPLLTQCHPALMKDPKGDVDVVDGFLILLYIDDE